VTTSRRDAIRLAKLLRAGELTAVWVPDEIHGTMRGLVRARGAAVETQRVHPPSNRPARPLRMPAGSSTDRSARPMQDGVPPPHIIFDSRRYCRLRQRLAQIPSFTSRKAVDRPPAYCCLRFVAAHVNAAEHGSLRDAGGGTPGGDRPYRPRAEVGGRPLPLLVALAVWNAQQPGIWIDRLTGPSSRAMIFVASP
jgi:hypothetical protein